MLIRYPHMDAFWTILGFTAIGTLCVAGILAGLRADASELRRFSRQALAGVAVLSTAWCAHRFLPDDGPGGVVLVPLGWASFLFTSLAWVYLFAGFGGAARAGTRRAGFKAVASAALVLSLAAVWRWV